MTINSLGSQELSYLSGMSATEGYQLLNKTLPQSVTNFEKTPQAQSDINYFETTIAKTTSVSQFLGNTRLVDFVLSAFGLDQEDGYQGLIKEVLTQDPNAPGSLVNQLTDPRFKQMASALDFFNDGLGQLQAAGGSTPTTANLVEGVTLASSSSPSTVAAQTSVAAAVLTTSVNTNIAIGIGVQLGAGQYFSVQEPNGSTGYAQSGYLTINSNSQLALPDGSTLGAGITVPSDATSLSIQSNGVIEAQEPGQPTPTIIGEIDATSFSDPTQLTTDSSGYYQPTAGSGSATPATLGAFSTFGATNQVVTSYTVPSTFAATSGSSSGNVSVGIGITGGQYLVLQRPDGSTAYASSAYFSLNSEGQLATSDGSTMQPPVTLPSDTTAVTVTSSGAIYAQESGSTTPTNVGTLEVATFTDPSALTSDGNGYYTPSSSSGSATLGFVTGTSYSFGNTMQELVNDYVQNEFETAVGSSNSAVREALYFQRTIGGDEASVATSSITTQADVILGDSVLSNVAETLLAQPAQIAYEQLSRQESIIETGLDLKTLGSSSSASYIASLTARYLSEYDASTAASANAANSPALQILSAFNSSSSSSSSSGNSLLSLFA